MSDPVTLYVQCLPTRPEAFGTWFCEASPAEVLAHPAVVALTAELFDARMAVNVEPGETVGHAIRALAAEGQSHLDAYAEEAVKCARLQAVLAAERGERGPEGWRWEDFGRAGEWRYPTPTGAGSLIVRRSMSVRRWVLERWHDGEFVSAHDYALEAMEAADRAADTTERKD